MMKMEFKEIICITLIIGCLVLKALGVDDIIDTILIAAASFYFGLHLPKPKNSQ